MLHLLVQQGAWHMQRESMPLAIGYLASSIKNDPEFAADCDVVLKNYNGHKTAFGMAVDLLCEPPPDVLGFSVLGWNIRQFASVAAAIKQASPATVVAQDPVRGNRCLDEPRGNGSLRGPNPAGGAQ